MGEKVTSDKGILIEASNELLLSEVSQLIEESRKRVSQTVNREMVLLYWNIGKQISVEFKQGERAQYGAKVIENLSSLLTNRFGKGFSSTALKRMVNFYEQNQGIEIGASLTHQLSWTHIVALLPIEDKLKREFYIQQ